MVTGPQAVLDEASALLKELSVETGTTRFIYLNRSVRRLLRVRRWEWAKVAHTLDTDNGVQEYDLTAEITDFNPQWGIYEVYIGGEKASPTPYDNISNQTNEKLFYLKPDGKTIGFIKALDGTETDIVIWYYPRWVTVTSVSDTFNISLPEDVVSVVALHMKYLVHDGKRQRYDARNALLDYKEEVEELIMQDAGNKTKDSPKTIPPITSYYGTKRTYTY